MSELIFSKIIDYEIELMEYISEIYDVEMFTNDVIDDLYLAGIMVEEQVLVLTKEKKVWILKIKRD